jgi:hypothetical protein
MALNTWIWSRWIQCNKMLHYNITDCSFFSVHSPSVSWLAESSKPSLVPISHLFMCLQHIKQPQNGSAEVNFKFNSPSSLYLFNHLSFPVTLRNLWGLNCHWQWVGRLLSSCDTVVWLKLNQCFRWMCCLHLQDRKVSFLPRRRRQHVPPKRPQTSTRLPDVTFYLHLRIHLHCSKCGCYNKVMPCSWV